MVSVSLRGAIKSDPFLEELKAISFGFLVSTPGYPARVIDRNTTYKRGMSAGSQTQSFFPVSLVCKLAMCSTAERHFI